MTDRPFEAVFRMASESLPQTCGRCGTPDSQCDVDCVEAAHGRQAIHEARKALNAMQQQLTELLPWKRALEDIGVVHWTLTEENSKDPKRLIYDTVAQLIREQLDPAVSEQAAELAELKSKWGKK